MLGQYNCGLVRRTQHQCISRPSIIGGFWLLLVLVATTWCSSPAFAQIPRIQGQGAAASGMGNAFAAQADNPSALHYNPAGMTQLRGVQIMAGGLLVGGPLDHRSPSGTTTAGDHDGVVAWPPPAHTYVTANLQGLGIPLLDKLTVGVGVTTPFGSATRWPSTSPFSATTIFSALPLFDIKPTFAYQLLPDLSIGAGIDIYTFSSLFGEGHAEFQRILPPGNRVEVNGKDTALGFNIGTLYTALRNADGLPIMNVAVVYRSQATLHLDGVQLANGVKVQDTTTTLVLPQVITGGIAVWPVRNAEREWKLELNVDYIGWKSVRNLDLRRRDGTVILEQPQNWKSTYAILVGTEYRWLKMDRLPGWEVAVRGGYSNLQTQVPDSTYNPAIPSADLHIISTGVGFVCKGNGSLFGFVACGNLGIGSIKAKTIGVDLSYQVSLYEPRTVEGNTGIRVGVNGFYENTAHAGGLSIRVGF
ncbi:MAG: long-chain fatty acid transporter [Nitrospira sp. CG24B]|nr:MAG: long-chain fatty acid transporter [Nitrospira sp. CG24B]